MFRRLLRSWSNSRKGSKSQADAGDELIAVVAEIRAGMEELRQANDQLRSDVQGIKQGVDRLERERRGSLFSLDKVLSVLLWVFPFGLIFAGASTVLYTGNALIRKDTKGQPLEPWLSVVELVLAVIALAVSVGLVKTLRTIPKKKRQEMEYERAMFAAIGMVAPVSIPMLRWVNVLAIDLGVDGPLFTSLRVFSLVPLTLILVLVVRWMGRRVRNRLPEHQSVLLCWSTPSEFLLIEMATTVFMVSLMTTVNPLANMR